MVKTQAIDQRKPRISIITVCYNAVNTIENTILSVVNQTYDNIEYIIIDGSSTDGTVDIIKQYENKISKWVSEPDKGIYDAMNKGLEMCSGAYVNFMNAGDFFYNPDVLSDLFSRITKEYDVVIGDTAVELGGEVFKQKARPFYEHLPLHHNMGFYHQSSFVRTELAKKLKFNLEYKLAADYNMIISIYKNGGKFVYLPDIIICQYDLFGISHDKNRQHTFETLQIDHPERKYLNYVLSSCFAFFYFLRLVTKNCLSKICPSLIRKKRMRHMVKLSK